MRKNHNVFWRVAGLSGISFAITAFFKFSCLANDFLYDISLGIFAGTVVALISIGIEICTSRRASIQRMLLEVRHIKALHNELCYAKTDAEIVRIAKLVDRHFDFFQTAMSSIDWIFCERRDIKGLFNQVCGYLMNTNPILIASANQNSDELEQAKLRSENLREIDMTSVIKIWIPLVKKYDPKALEEYSEVDKWQNIYRKGHAYRTIGEINNELKKEVADHGQA